MTVVPRARLLLLLSLSLLASPAARSAPSEPWPHEHSDVAPDPRVLWGRLENGLRYAIRQNHEPRGRVYLILEVHAGSLHERPDQSGYAHFVEHMMFNGTRHHPGHSLVEQLQREGLEFGADSSAFTNYDYTFYNLDVPGNSRERIAYGLGVLREFMDGATFEKAEVKQEIGVIESERRTRDTGGARVGELLDAFLFPESRLPSSRPIGTPESVKTATPARLREFYQTWYRPSRTTIIAVGDAEPALIEEVIREQFGSFQAATPAEPPETDAGRLTADDGVMARYFDSHADAGTSSVIYCISPLGTDHADTIAARHAKLVQSAGFLILNERLQQIARNNAAELGRGLAGWQDGLHHSGFCFVQVDSRPQLWRRGLRTAEQELRRALQLGFNDEEVREQIARFRNFFSEAVHTDPTLASPAIAHSLRSTLENDWVFSSPETNRSIMEEAMTQLTPESCLAAFQRSWAPGNRRVALIGQERARAGDADILNAYNESHAGQLFVRDDATPLQFGYGNFGPPGGIEKREHVAAIDAESVLFANRVRLNVKRTDYEAGRIFMRVRLGHGLAEQPADQPGVGMIAAGGLLNGGVKKHDVQELQRFTAGNTLSLEFTVEEDACFFTGTANRDSLELLLQILTAYLSEPAFRPNGFQSSLAQIQAHYAQTNQDPVAFLQAVAPQILAGGDLRYGLPHFDKVSARTPEQVQAWLTPILASASLEIGIAGDLDTEAAIAATARTLATLPRRSEPAPPSPEPHPSFPAKALQQSFRIRTVEPKSVVQVSWPGCDGLNYHLDRKLRLLAEILQDRLRVKLREELGATYNASVQSWGSGVWKDFGLFSAVVITAPDQAGKVARLVRDITASLRDRGITDDEFNRARQPMLAGLDQVTRQNSYWAFYVLDRLQQYPDAINVPLSRSSDYQNMTKRDVEEVARQFLQPKRACTFIVSPLK